MEIKLINNFYSVGLINDGFVPIMDGVTLTVRNYAYWLTKSDVRSVVVGPAVPKYKEREIFPVLRYKSFPIPFREPYRFGLPKLDRNFMKNIESQDLDLIHVHSPFGAGSLGLYLSKKRKIPLVATFHSKYHLDLECQIGSAKVVDFCIKKIADFYGKVDEVWVPQETIAETLRSYGYQGAYRVMPNGTDLQIREDISELKKIGGAYLDFNDLDVVGLFVGQHATVKNLEAIIQSLPAIMKSLDRFKMVFVGTGSYKNEMIKQVTKSGVKNRTLFLDPIYDRALLESIYARADIFIFPSIYDNTPLVVIEAAAMQTPSVLVSGSDAATSFTHLENGYLCDGTPKGISDVVITALRDLDRNIRIGLAAQKSIPVPWEQIVAKVKNRYQEILRS